MKKLLILLLFSTWQLFALDKASTTKMYHHVLHTLTHKDTIKLYTQDKEYINVFADYAHISIVKKTDNADVVLITEESDLSNLPASPKQILFATSYQLLKKNNDIIGALYWRKGRSQLVFIKDRLEKHGIVLPFEYQKFIIEAL